MVVVAVVALLGAIVTLATIGDEDGDGPRLVDPSEVEDMVDDYPVEPAERVSRTHISALVVGDCLPVEPGYEGSTQDLEAISCEEPHRSEVFAELTLEGDDSDYPGDVEVGAAVEQLCYGQPFADYVGVPYDVSSLWVSSVSPSPDGWAGGSRDITCFVHAPDPAAITTGSFRDSEI
jgi:hypothetical protein